MKRGDYVKIGRTGRKVYQIYAVNERRINPTSRFDTEVELIFKLSATADHPDAAVREQDAFRWYTEDELTVVRRRT